MSLLSVVFGCLVGLALGLTGGGGSIFAVPLLIYGLGVTPASAVAISLVAVAVTSATGAAEGLARGVVELRAGLILALAGVVSAPVGVYLGGLVTGRVIVVAFAVLMCVVALRMLIRARGVPEQARIVRSRIAPDAAADRGTVCRYSQDGRLRLNAPCSAALLAAGLAVGVLSGFFGVGGGFLIVPALMLITEMGIHRAVATSLLVIVLVGLSGVMSSLAAGRAIDWALALLFILGGILGMLGGRLLARRLAGVTLQTLFALAMLGIALFMLVS